MEGLDIEEMLNWYKDYDIFVYSATYCPYCDEAKTLAKSIKGISVGTLELDEIDDSVKQALIAKTKQRTVPQVYVKGEFVGGCSDLKALNSSGKLKAKLGLD